MIPAWKLRREWESLKQQLQALPERWIGPARQRRLDARFPADCRVRDGAVPLGEKVAILLLYQPRGMAASALATVEHLTGRGYAVLAVVNHPVSPADAERLLPRVWRCVERPNFGYDFGGYRDAIRLLQRWRVEPAHTLLLNDSVWFPLDPAEGLIGAFEASPAWFGGAFRFVDPPGHDAEHAGIFLSYCFHFRAPLWRHDAFVAFWRDYVCSSNKVLTVKRGERGFSRALFAAGVPSEGVWSRDRLLEALRPLPDAEWRRVLDYAAYTDEPLARERDALLAEPPDAPAWRDRAWAHLQAAAARRNPLSTFVYASVRWAGVPFLKKNAGELQVRMRRQYLRAVAAGDLPSPGDALLAEIRARTPD